MATTAQRNATFGLRAYRACRCCASLADFDISETQIEETRLALPRVVDWEEALLFLPVDMEIQRRPIFTRPPAKL